LMSAFGLTEIQAEDILEIRLRQLARLEGFKLEKELNELREEQGRLNILLGDENEKRKLIIKEMQADMKQFGDARRTLVEEAGRAVLTQTTADEPITLILSEKGWIRSRAGHNLDLSQTAFKEGDRLKQTLEGRTVLPVVILDSLGRTYTLDAAEIPGGRGDGVPVSSLIELQNGAKPVAMLTGQPEQHYLLSGSSGYGFITKLADMIGRVKAGKVVMTVDSGETVLPPVAVYSSSLFNPDCKILLASSDHRLLAFSIGELKVMPKGRGLQLMSLTDGASLEHTAVISSAEFTVETVGRRGAVHQERLRIRDIDYRNQNNICGHPIWLIHTIQPHPRQGTRRCCTIFCRSQAGLNNKADAIACASDIRGGCHDMFNGRKIMRTFDSGNVLSPIQCDGNNISHAYIIATCHTSHQTIRNLWQFQVSFYHASGGHITFRADFRKSVPQSLLDRF